MKRSKRENRFVIFSGPQQHQRPGTKYYALDGGVTDSKSTAAKFYSWDDAKEFADEKKIELTTYDYIGQEDFLHHELST